MRCWRIDIQQNFSRYLDGELDSQHTQRLEDHLLDCDRCRARVARLREGQRFARQIPQPAPRRDPWDEIENAIKDESRPFIPVPELKEQSGSKLFVTRPGTLIVLTAIVFLIVLLGVVATPERNVAVYRELDLDPTKFEAVTIADLHTNTRPHVVTEGYVSEMRMDVDGDLTFRLVEDISRPEPFIVCEIVPPIALEPPVLGSRVKVYGVSRYDNQPGRDWYEVHPVLSIQTVQ